MKNNKWIIGKVQLYILYFIQRFLKKPFEKNQKCFLDWENWKLYKNNEYIILNENNLDKKNLNKIIDIVKKFDYSEFVEHIEKLNWLTDKNLDTKDGKYITDNYDLKKDYENIRKLAVLSNASELKFLYPEGKRNNFEKILECIDKIHWTPKNENNIGSKNIFESFSFLNKNRKIFVIFFVVSFFVLLISLEEGKDPESPNQDTSNFSSYSLEESNDYKSSGGDMEVDTRDGKEKEDSWGEKFLQNIDSLISEQEGDWCKLCKNSEEKNCYKFDKNNLSYYKENKEIKIPLEVTDTFFKENREKINVEDVLCTNEKEVWFLLSIKNFQYLIKNNKIKYAFQNWDYDTVREAINNINTVNKILDFFVANILMKDVNLYIDSGAWKYLNEILFSAIIWIFLAMSYMLREYIIFLLKGFISWLEKTYVLNILLLFRKWSHFGLLLLVVLLLFFSNFFVTFLFLVFLRILRLFYLRLVIYNFSVSLYNFYDSWLFGNLNEDIYDAENKKENLKRDMEFEIQLELDKLENKIK